MKLSVIIPAFNEGNNIVYTLAEVKDLLISLTEVREFEIIIVDDHSTDNTFNKVKDINDKSFCAIRLSKQSGSHSAIRAGLSVCSGDAAFCMSADGQDDPNVIPQMIELLKNNNEVIWAHRIQENKISIVNIFRILFYLILKFSIKLPTIDPATADYFLIGRKMIDGINSCNERNTSLYGLITWLGFNQVSVFYKRRNRRGGKSKWNLKSRIKLASDWIISFSGIPLKAITFLGFSTACIGLVYAIYIMVLGIMKLTTPGWAETIIVILILGGIQMIMLGMTGEYIWRNLEESRKRPCFIIEDSTNLKL